MKLFQRFLNFWDMLYSHNLDYPVIMLFEAGMIILSITILIILIKFGVIL